MLGALVVVLGVGVGLARVPEGTSAFWTDSVAGTSRITVAAPALPEKPVPTSCTRTGNSIRLTWTSTSSPQSFQIRHTNPTAEPTVAGTSRAATTQNANFNNSVGEVWWSRCRTGSSRSPPTTASAATAAAHLRPGG